MGIGRIFYRWGVIANFSEEANKVFTGAQPWWTFISSAPKLIEKHFPTDKLITNYQIQSTLLSNENFNNLTRTQSAQWKNAQSTFSFTSPQPIRPKEASDSDFTIEDVMLWPGMRFSLRSQCMRCSAGRLHTYTFHGSETFRRSSKSRSRLPWNAASFPSNHVLFLRPDSSYQQQKKTCYLPIIKAT